MENKPINHNETVYRLLMLLIIVLVFLLKTSDMTM